MIPSAQNRWGRADTVGCGRVRPCAAVAVGGTRPGLLHPRLHGRWWHRAHIVHHRPIHSGMPDASSKPPAAFWHGVLSTPWRRSWSAVGASLNTFVAGSVQGWLPQEHVGPRYIEPSAPWESSYGESFHAKCAKNCCIVNPSSTCAKSTHPPTTTTPTNTTSNDRTAAWTKDHQPWARSANFRPCLRPVLQLALVLLP